MRIVHEHHERLSLVDALEATGHLGGRFQTTHQDVEPDAKREGAPGGHQRIAHVVRARERERDLGLLFGRQEAEGRGIPRRPFVHCPDHRPVGPAYGPDVVERGGEPRATQVVYVHHPRSYFEIREEPTLDRPVLVERPVIVEVVLREIGERRDREPQRVDAVQIDGVR